MAFFAKKYLAILRINVDLDSIFVQKTSRIRLIIPLSRDGNDYLIHHDCID